MNKDILTAAGVNYDDALHRFMNKEALLERVLNSFLNEKSMPGAIAAFASGNMDELLERVHELKGVSGNLSMTELHRLATELTSKLRAKDYADVGERMAKLKKEYDAIRAAVEKALGK